MFLANGGSSPTSFAVASSGYLFMASGAGAMVKWDGLANGVYLVGVQPPATGFTAAGSGSGSLSGTYKAYMRYVDKDGNPSNAAPILGVSFTLANHQTVQYSGLEVPSASPNIVPGTQDATKYVRRQILRSTNGEATTFYIDIDTNDVTSTTLYSDNTTVGADGNVGTGGNTTGANPGNTDAQLSARIATSQTAAQLFLYGTPPNTKSIIANHLGRMFAVGNYFTPLLTCEVVNGSSTVTLVGSVVSSAALNRFLYVQGGLTPYTITAVGNQNNVGLLKQTLTISPAYTGVTDAFAQAQVQPLTSDLRTIYYSQALAPDAWPATNSIVLQEDGDTITGLIPFGSFLYILERHHIYRFAYQTDPATDGFVFLVLNRGCVNNRCWVAVEGVAYMLDEQGIHAYSGASSSDPISTTVQDLFRFSDSPYRVNWQAQQWFHCVHFAPQETIRWFVTLSGQQYPYHAIAYNYRQKRWWIEEFAVPIGSSALGLLNSQPQVFLGANAGRVLAMWQGTLDGPDPSGGRVRGQVEATQSLVDFFDATATTLNPFPTKGVINNPVCIVDGRGKGQRNIVVGVSPSATNGALINCRNVWAIRPDSTSVYQLGGIQWHVQFGWWRWVYGEEETERVFTCVAQPCTAPTIASVQLFVDFATQPVSWQGAFTLADGNGVRTTAGSPDIDLDLTKPTGYFEKRMPGHREFFTDGARYISFRLFGTSNVDQQRIYWVMCTGADQGG